jgi:hypothetical protein
MRIAIIGGRDFNDYKLMCSILEPYKHKITKVISGAAPGADSLGAKWSKEFLKKEPLEYKALWNDLTKEPCLIKMDKNGNPFNCLAGFNRNTDIIKNCDVCFAFWDGKSKGTKDSLDKCDKFKKPKKIIYYEP